MIGELTYLKTSEHVAPGQSGTKVPKYAYWAWLRENRPEDYDQLISMLSDHAEGLGQTNRRAIRQLAGMFQWCQEHGIEFTLFDLPGHLRHYREAASYLYHMVADASNEQGAEQGIRDAVAEINEHETYHDTRAMLRRLPK